MMTVPSLKTKLLWMSEFESGLCDIHRPPYCCWVSSILAFIDFGMKLATAAYEAYESKEGATAGKRLLFITIP